MWHLPRHLLRAYPEVFSSKSHRIQQSFSLHGFHRAPQTFSELFGLRRTVYTLDFWKIGTNLKLFDNGEFVFSDIQKKNTWWERQCMVYRGTWTPDKTGCRPNERPGLLFRTTSTTCFSTNTREPLDFSASMTYWTVEPGPVSALVEGEHGEQKIGVEHLLWPWTWKLRVPDQETLNFTGRFVADADDPALGDNLVLTIRPIHLTVENLQHVLNVYPPEQLRIEPDVPHAAC
eukprot:gnl/Spiro4/7118_TR3706_c0_g1_i1.p2 gnl/Spiro4/7118_TR3706_c0_g1~~gnl/Spiro4/7118_TR3706_c0_g1_i1.p2  ORF type:complete len:232 (+),score=57.71 gnl/Spiro4/7118_TR3706_c0_g1_i1:77-772(+)